MGAVHPTRSSRIVALLFVSACSPCAEKTVGSKDAAAIVATKTSTVAERSIRGVVSFEGAPRPPSFTVSLSDRIEKFSSADGSFRLSPIPDRLATLHFEAPGFASANVYTAIPERGEANVAVTMYPACFVRGIVRDRKKEPIPGALVTLAHADKTLYWFQRPNVQSGADGKFELGDVPPGRMHLAV